MHRSLSLMTRRVAQVLAVAFAAWLCAACVTKPSMRINHAEVTGVRIAFPPSLGVLMTIHVDVFNPNSYDIAIRAVRGQVLLANRYTLAVDFRPTGDGVWLGSNSTTSVAVPVSIPMQVGLAVLAETLATPMIPYHFSGKADVTATRTFQLEKDDYSVSEDGVIPRQQIDMVVRSGR
jgi:hypothetical protein